MEIIGYDYIEYQESEENFREACDANEYTFEADGTMRNVIESANDMKLYD